MSRPVQFHFFFRVLGNINLPLQTITASLTFETDGDWFENEELGYHLAKALGLEFCHQSTPFERNLHG